MTLLNRRTYFWTSEKRVAGLRSAKGMRDAARSVLVVDTLSLAETHADAVEIAPFNTGATIHQSPRRGLWTFTPLADVDYPVWQRRRAVKSPDTIVEVTVTRPIADFWRHVVDVRPSDSVAALPTKR